MGTNCFKLQYLFVLFLITFNILNQKFQKADLNFLEGVYQGGTNFEYFYVFAHIQMTQSEMYSRAFKANYESGKPASSSLTKRKSPKRNILSHGSNFSLMGFAQ